MERPRDSSPLLTARVHDHADDSHMLAWSAWRRWHQGRAPLYHDTQRTGSEGHLECEGPSVPSCAMAFHSPTAARRASSLPQRASPCSWRVSAGVQDLPNDAPERGGRVRFHQVGHAPGGRSAARI